ncbi:caspase family protein [Aquabacterium sp. CECT 9606]|uniref:caspase family protein n=1 Tax=Aquabacterium sp. CECT 9606 TaxID=2845822 RepID=UPI001E56F0F1|nr:caspase family protein [Aquabacterium sp. CECT 9606]CAH0353157.1 hypothetical protein AQB9606_03090 [Aquabacterium sp. CECT 9606]
MPTDAVIVSVADYPSGNRLLRALPGAARDSQRMQKWLQANTEGVSIRDFTWPPPPPALPGADALPWNRLSIEATMQQLLVSGLHKTRDRLFFYASAHGMSVPTNPAMPAVFCASHWPTTAPDLFLSSGWVPQFTGAPVYDEYLCFFDCCNEWQPGTLPVFQPLNLPARPVPPRVLVVAACKPGQQALDTPTGGVFTDVLLEALSGSAGKPGTAQVTAADVVAYLKENVVIRAAQVKPGHVQTPVEWMDPNAHADLNAFLLFDRLPVNAADVTSLLDGRDPSNVEVLDAELEPSGTVLAAPDGVAMLPNLFAGKYVLRCATDGWKKTIRLKTTVADDGSVVSRVEALP